VYRSVAVFQAIPAYRIAFQRTRDAQDIPDRAGRSGEEDDVPERPLLVVREVVGEYRAERTLVGGPAHAQERVYQEQRQFVPV